MLQALADLAGCATVREALDCTARAVLALGQKRTWALMVQTEQAVLSRPSVADARSVGLPAFEALRQTREQPGASWMALRVWPCAAPGAGGGIRQVLVAPILAGEALVGAFVLWGAGRRAGTARRARLATLTRHLGAVLDRLHLLDELRDSSQQLVAAHAQLEAYARDMRVTYEAEREQNRQLRRAYEDLIRVLATAIEERDDYTGGHIRRVAGYAVAIGRELGLRGGDLQALEMGAILHDIGKIGITDAILRKRGVLGPLELQRMREHPAIGARMLEQIPFLRPALDAVLAHHERVDGAGYPRGLAGEDIPLVGRIVAVADAFDAMTTDRPYRPACSHAEALVELRRQVGRQLDPGVVAAFEALWHSGKLDPSPARREARSVS